MTAPASAPLVVLLHAPEDDDLRAELTRHLTPLQHAGAARFWHRGLIRSGEAEEEVTAARLAAADLVLILVSADYLAHRQAEMDSAVALAAERGRPIVPALLRPCQWDITSLKGRRPLPAGGVPVSSQPDRDAAWHGVAGELATLLQTLPAAAPPARSVRPARPAKAQNRARPQVDPTRPRQAADAPLARSTPPPAPSAVAPPPDNRALRGLATAGDEAIRAVALERLVRAPALAEEDRAFLRGQIGTMTYALLLDVLERHGDLGASAVVVERLAEGFPADDFGQLQYVSFISAVEHLPRWLGDAAFGTFVEKIAPRASDHVRLSLLVTVRGCALYNALIAADGQRPRELRLEVEGPLVEALIGLRTDEAACRVALETRIANAPTRELLRMEYVLSCAGCEDLAEQARTRLVERFGVVLEQDDRGRPSLDALHCLFVRDRATAAGPDRPERMAWLADRLLDLESRGFSFFGPSRDKDLFPEALRVELARLLADGGKAPWWAGDVLLERLSTGSAEAWRAVFAWWLPWTPALWYLDHKVRKAMLLNAPFPLDPPEDFDERYLACFRDEMAYEEHRAAPTRDELVRKDPARFRPDMLAWQLDEAIGLGPAEHQLWGLESLRPFLKLRTALRRLLDLPLVPARATRLARLLREHPWMFRHSRIGELAELAEPMSVVDLPSPDALELRDARQIEAYRLLGGHAADERLRACARALLEAEPQAREVARSLAWPWRWFEYVVDDALKSDLRARLVGAGLGEIARLRRAAPWLVDRHMVHEAAARALDEEAHWPVADLPPSVAPLVLERARRTGDEHEVAALLGWLEERGVSRQTRVELVLGRLATVTGADWLVPLVPMLVTPGAWENEGRRAIELLAARDRWHRVYSLWATLSEALRRRGEGAGSDDASSPSPSDGPAVFRAAHVAFAVVLLDLAAGATGKSEEPRVLAALDALSRLDPGPAATRRLREIAISPHLTDKARERARLALTLLESTPAGSPGLQGLLDAAQAIYAAPDA